MPTPNTPPPDPEDDLAPHFPSDELRQAYYLALGKFVDAFGRAETSLAYMLARFSARAFREDTTQGRLLAQALVGPRRTSDLTDILKEVMRMAGSDEKYQKEAEVALNHLGEIRHLRDKIVHNSATLEFFDGAWSAMSSNRFQVRKSAQTEEVYFTIDDLDNMTDDLGSLIMRVRNALFTTLRAEVEKTKAWTDAQKPWRYKPSGLKRRGPKHQPTKRKSSNPRQSSQK